MSTSTGDKKIRTPDPGWVLLAEYALDEMVPDNGNEDGLTAGFLIQSFQEWGIPPELICKIESRLTEFAPKPGFLPKQGTLERAARLRVFCPKKVIDCAKAGKTSRPDHAESTLEAQLEAAPIQTPSGANLNRGWGYFIIERSGGDASASERCSLWVDLYLYQEGE